MGMWGGVAVPPPEFVQAKSVYSKSTAITLDSGVTSGNQLIAVLVSTASIDFYLPALAASGGCSSSWDASLAEIHPTGGMYVKIFTCSNSTSGLNAVSIIGWGGGDASWYLVEGSNIGAFDVSSSGYAASGTTYNSGDATPNTANSFMIGVYGSTSLGAPTWEGTWTSRAYQSGHVSGIATKTVTSTSAQSASGIIDNSVPWTSWVIVMKGQ